MSLANTVRRPAELVEAGLMAPERLAELEAVAARYFDGDRNVVRQDYVMARGMKR